KVLYLSAYTLTFNEFLVCQWFYQAIEELKIIATLSIISKVTNVILIFLLVKSPSNYYFVSLITGGAYFFTGVYSILHMFRHHIKFVVPSISVIINVTKDSFNLFLTSAIIAIKNKLDVILIGAFISSEMVAIYDFAQKILNILLLPITIISNATFPRMNREKNKIFLKKIILVSFGLTFTYITFSELLLPYIMHYIFVVSHDSINITRLMILSAIFLSLSLPLAQNGLIVFNYTKLHLLGMLSTTALYIGIMALGYKCSLLTDVYYFVYTSLILFAYEAFYRYSFCKWKRIL
ncbi:O54 family O-antigen flippase, partial [Escherichia coli]|nr:O54 family O-antigen flippase [Escherichia coli]